MPKMKDLCRRLETWLGKNLPAALASFNPGATDKQIAEHERGTGFELPNDVRGWYRWRNGQKHRPDESMLFGDRLLSLGDSLKEWKFWQTVADMNKEVAEACTSIPEGAIVAAYSLPGWIPLAQSPANVRITSVLTLTQGQRESKDKSFILVAMWK